MTKKKVWKHKYKDFINAIKHTKEPLLDGGEDEYDQEMMEKDYSPYLIQKGLIKEENIHTINKINLKHMIHNKDMKKLHFDYLLHSIKKTDKKKKK